MSDSEEKGTAGPQVSPAEWVDEFLARDGARKGWDRDWSEQYIYLWQYGPGQDWHLSVSSDSEDGLVVATVAEAVE